LSPIVAPPASVYCAASSNQGTSAKLLNWRKKKPASGRLALHRGSGGLSYAELTWGTAGPSITACGSRPGDATSVESWANFGRAPVPVSLVLSPGEYQLLPIDAPPVPAQELTLAVRWRIKDLIDFPVESATVDVFRVAGTPTDAGGKLLAVVARNDVLRGYFTLAEQAGVDLAVVDIAELAQRNIAARLESPGRLLALLSLTPDGGLLTVTLDGELCFHRRVQFRLGADGDVSNEAGQAALQRLALELQRSLDYIERHHSGWRLDRILLAPQPAADVMPFLRDYLLLPLELADLGQVFDGPLPEPDVLAACWFALGGALRRETIDL